MESWRDRSREELFAALHARGEGLAVYHPFLQRILHTTPLSLGDWTLITVAAASVIVFEEVRKGALRWLRRMKEGKRPR